MTQIPPNASNTGDTPSNEEAQELMHALRRKAGNWVQWGEACAKLQKAGYNAQAIFEATGFEPVQQNQVIVGAQVYASLEKAGVSAEVRSHYSRKGSDILYELRLLAGSERANAAEFILSHQLDSDGAHEVARAMKEYSYLRTSPSGFSDHPGDTIAYQCWKLARQQTDLQERSRLIAKGLKFAHTPTARQQIEQLLVDFTAVPQRPAPNMPIYRLDSDEELPRVVPVVGQMPLTPKDLQAVPLVEETGAFRMVKFAGEQAWVPLPGWQVVLSAQDPVAILCDSNNLPTKSNTAQESVLVVVDRAQRQWEANSYFVVDQSGQLDFRWFESAPEFTLLGRIIVVVRPKKILDEELNQDSWQIDE